MQQDKVIVRQLGTRPWTLVSDAMHEFTDNRDTLTLDEIWLVEHPPVFTQGKAGKIEHLLMPGDIPVMQSDRGGQVTYHAPGQQVLYLLIDLKRRGLSIRQLVNIIENAVIKTLSYYHIPSHSRADAPGVYVEKKKICSLGLRVRRGCSFHGLALNVDMDLSPFSRINPCGYAGLEMTQVSALCPGVTLDAVRPVLVNAFSEYLGASAFQYIDCSVNEQYNILFSDNATGSRDNLFSTSR